MGGGRWEDVCWKWRVRHDICLLGIVECGYGIVGVGVVQ
jgi:hypothetical protein